MKAILEIVVLFSTLNGMPADGPVEVIYRVPYENISRCVMMSRILDRDREDFEAGASMLHGSTVTLISTECIDPRDIERYSL